MYENSSKKFTEIVKSHFENIKQKGKYGVYIVRQKETNEVLYIGKAGTINQNGEFKNQDLIGRLTNVRGEISANEWFKNLYKEKGPLIVEYILLPETISPGYVENLLLQLYLNEHGRLPCKNEKL